MNTLIGKHRDMDIVGHPQGPACDVVMSRSKRADMQSLGRKTLGLTPDYSSDRTVNIFHFSILFNVMRLYTVDIPTKRVPAAERIAA